MLVETVVCCRVTMLHTVSAIGLGATGGEAAERRRLRRPERGGRVWVLQRLGVYFGFIMAAATRDFVVFVVVFGGGFGFFLHGLNLGRRGER